MATREQIVSALFARIVATGAFPTTGRRNRDTENLGPSQTPAFFLVEDDDEWQRGGGYNQRAVRWMNLIGIVYFDVGDNENAIPATLLNNTLDAIEAIFEPDDRQRGTFTLGGLVQACLIDGVGKRAPGDKTGKGLVVIPIKILIP